MPDPVPVTGVPQTEADSASPGKAQVTPALSSPTAWPYRRILLWWVLLNLACWYQGPWFSRVFNPKVVKTGSDTFLADFFQDWASAKNFWEGLPIYTPQELTVHRYLGIPRDPNDIGFIEINAHPPTSVLFFLGFAFLDFADAFLVWNILSLLALVVSLLLIVCQLKLSFSGWEVLRIATLLLVCEPFWQQMLQGQFNLVLLLAITCAWAADRSGQQGLAGGLLGVATAIKLFPAFLFLYFLVARRWRVIATGAITIAALTILTALVFGPEIYLTYFHDARPHVTLYRGAWYNLSLPSVWAKLFDPGKQFSGVLIQPLVESPFLAVVGAAASVIIVLAVLVWVVSRSRSQTDFDEAFSLTLIGMLLVLPITWEHYGMLLVLPIFVLWPRVARFKLARLGFIAALSILWLTRYRVVSHVMILMGAENHPGMGWISTPWNSVTALSVSTYALLTLFVLGFWAVQRSSSLREDTFTPDRSVTQDVVGMHKGLA
jgi:hypothetical protein